MNYYNRNQYRPVQQCRSGMAAAADHGEKRAAVCRSAFMQSEEIRREREMSGWNPYVGEEEDFAESMDEMGTSSGYERMDGSQGRQDEMMPPYFTMPNYEQVLEEQKMTERDLRMLQSMFPDGAKLLLPYIEEECDKMEYEGSPMFDEYPDRTTIYRIQDRIYEAVKDQFPEQPEAEPDDMLTMQYQGRRRNPPGRNWLRDMIQTMLLQEIHHRRCRHGRCGRQRRY